MKTMRRRKNLTILSLTTVMLAVMTMPAMAYVIDGELDDWGVCPSCNNPDTCWDSWSANLPALSEVENWPYGGGNPGIEQCDIEAMYVSEDVNGSYIYFAIITSMPPEGFNFSCGNEIIRLIPGDLALDFDNGGGFEYGVKLTEYDYSGAGKGDPVEGDIGDVFKNPKWEKITTQCAQNNPPYFSNMVNYTNTERTWEAEYGVGKDIVYEEYSDWLWDDGQKNYVIEMRIPKAAFGISTEGEVGLMATESCTNDVIQIEKYCYTPIPEFTTIAIPVCLILGLFYFHRRKQQRGEK